MDKCWEICLRQCFRGILVILRLTKSKSGYNTPWSRLSPVGSFWVWKPKMERKRKRESHLFAEDANKHTHTHTHVSAIVHGDERKRKVAWSREANSVNGGGSRATEDEKWSPVAANRRQQKSSRRKRASGAAAGIFRCRWPTMAREWSNKLFLIPISWLSVD